jgi:ketosteroid isomerase-like protein
MNQTTIDRTRTIFGSLTLGDFDAFLPCCADDLVLAVRGTDPAITYVPKRQIPDWYESMHSLTGAIVRSSVEVVRVAGVNSIVVLRHSFERDGFDHEFEMVNICSYKKALLSTWSSYPLRLPDFAAALGIRRSILPQPA